MRGRVQRAVACIDSGSVEKRLSTDAQWEVRRKDVNLQDVERRSDKADHPLQSWGLGKVEREEELQGHACASGKSSM
jgi:hypothetical protein